jgi:hypothetical protein
MRRPLRILALHLHRVDNSSCVWFEIREFASRFAAQDGEIKIRHWVRLSPRERMRIDSRRTPRPQSTRFLSSGRRLSTAPLALDGVLAIVRIRRTNFNEQSQLQRPTKEGSITSATGLGRCFPVRRNRSQQHWSHANSRDQRNRRSTSLIVAIATSSSVTSKDPTS